MQNGFVEADTDETLGEIDNAIFRATMQAPISIQDQTKLFGFGFFYLAKLKGREQDDENLETLKKKQLLIYMMDECDRLLTKDLLFNVPVPQLTLRQLNSLVWFILHTRKLGLFPVKSDKLIVQLEDYVNSKMNKQPDAIDTIIFGNLINELKPLIPANLLKKYEKLPPVIILDNENGNEEQLVNQYIKSGWSPLLYNMEIPKIQNVDVEKAFEVIDNEENWRIRLDKLNKDNVGLDMGMGGIGMAVMGGKSERMKKMKKLLSARPSIAIKEYK